MFTWKVSIAAPLRCQAGHPGPTGQVAVTLEHTPIQQLRKGYYLETEGLRRAEVPALG